MTPKTKTRTKTFAYSRSLVVLNQFALILEYADIEEGFAEKILKSVRLREIEGVGAYIAENNERVAEVELSVDWVRHSEYVESQPVFDVRLRGWRDGVSGEVRSPIRCLSVMAEEMGAPIRIWVRFAQEIWEDSDLLKLAKEEFVCRGSVPPWKGGGSKRRLKKCLTQMR